MNFIILQNDSMYSTTYNCNLSYKIKCNYDQKALIFFLMCQRVYYCSKKTFKFPGG